jgi:hypothetical protein
MTSVKVGFNIEDPPSYLTVSEVERKEATSDMVASHQNTSAVALNPSAVLPRSGSRVGDIHWAALSARLSRAPLRPVLHMRLRGQLS